MSFKTTPPLCGFATAACFRRNMPRSRRSFRVLAVAAVVSSILATASASAAIVTANALFSATNQSIWNPGGAFFLGENKFIGPAPWNLGDGIDATERVCIPIAGCATFGARIGAETSGAFGVNYGYGVSGGSLNLRYPINASFSVPDNFSTFTDADFTIGSSWSTSPGGFSYYDTAGRIVSTPGTSLRTTGPEVGAYIDFFGNFHAFAGAQACIVACAGPALGPVDINYSAELVAVNRGGDGQIRVGGTEVGPNGDFNALGNLVTGHLRVPDLNATAVLNGSDLNTDKSTLVAGVNANLAQIAANAVGFPLPLAGNIGGLGYNLLQVDAGIAIELAQALGFVPVPTATLEFASPVQQRLGNGTYGAPTTSIQFLLGSSITLKAPGVTALGIIPTLSLANTVSNRTDLRLTGDLGVQALGVDIFGLQIGPLFDEHASALQFGSIPVFSNDFALNIAPIVARPFNVFFNPLSVLAEVTCVAINGCVFDIFNSVGQGAGDFDIAADAIERVECQLLRGIFLNCNNADAEVIGLTSPFAVSLAGGGIAVSELMGLTAAGTGIDSPGSAPGEAAALLARLGFSGPRSDFAIPAGDLVPPGLMFSVPEPSPLLLAGFGALMLFGLRRKTMIAR